MSQRLKDALLTTAWRLGVLSLCFYAVFVRNASAWWFVFAVAMCGVSPFNDWQ